MKYNKYIIIVLLFTNLRYAYPQQTVDNDKAHRRYWYYRTRMINDFMKIGKNQGDCIMISERNLGKNIGQNIIRDSQVGPDQIDLINMYIITLALEYKLLSRNNQDTKETVNELYHILYMINRLDGEADQLWGPIPLTNPIINQNNLNFNGFMIREDMPPDYLTVNAEHFNYDMLDNGNGIATISTAYAQNYGGFCGSDFTDNLVDTKFRNFSLQEINLTDNSTENDNIYKLRDAMGMPHDKFHSMLVAMMFVNKYLPYGVNNGQQFQDGEYDLKKEAKNISKRIYTYLKGINDSWVLTYPDFSTSNNHILNVGAQAQIYSWPLSRMACFANHDFPWAIADPCSGFTGPTAIGLGGQVYNTNSSIPQLSMDASVFMAWDQIGSNFPSNSGFVPAFIAMQANTSAWSIEWAELIRKVLHQNGALLRQLSIYGDPINVAPCQGPYNYGACNNGGKEWSSQDRTEHPNARNASCPSGNGFLADYPGVDYMLLHNLYYEYQNQLMDGNQGNVGNTPGGNISTWIYNAGNAVGSSVVSAGCSVINAISGLFGGSTSVCDPTNTSGNGGAGSNNVTLSPYYGYNLMDNTDENIWPRRIFYSGPFANSPTNIQGVNQAGNEGKVAVFQNLTLKSHIYATSSPAAPNNTIPSSITYRAGKEIIIPPGQFIVDNGATCHIYIQRYLCSGNNDALQMRHANDSTQMLEFQALDYETDPINPIPLHFIVSPKSDADNNPTVPETDYYQELKALESIRENAFLIAPNPSTGKITIYTKKIDASEKIDLQLVDMKGVLMLSLENINEEQTINLENYGEGIYMVQITSNFEKNIIKKITIIK